MLKYALYLRHYIKYKLSENELNRIKKINQKKEREKVENDQR